MARILACRVLSRELNHLVPDCSPDYFEPLCHKLRQREFVDYVGSLLLDQEVMICGDCGGLNALAESRGTSMPSADDCIELLIGDGAREPKTLYLTDGWIENLDRIFGLDRLPGEARKSVLGAIFSPIRKVTYISTDAPGGQEEGAREIAAVLGCEFSCIRGSLERMAEVLGDLG